MHCNEWWIKRPPINQTKCISIDIVISMTTSLVEGMLREFLLMWCLFCCCFCTGMFTVYLFETPYLSLWHPAQSFGSCPGLADPSPRQLSYPGPGAWQPWRWRQVGRPSPRGGHACNGWGSRWWWARRRHARGPSTTWPARPGQTALLYPAGLQKQQPTHKCSTSPNEWWWDESWCMEVEYERFVLTWSIT